MPPVQTDRNAQYGPPLVNQKYTPLANVVWAPADTPFYSGLLDFRRNTLWNANYLPKPLMLQARNWAAIDAAESGVGRQPPLVVVSSNRANWIAGGLAAADLEMNMQNGGNNFAGPSDFHALAAFSGQNRSSPIYTPCRQGPVVPGGPTRGVYVVVHASEYQTYQAALDPPGAPTGITVIGWDFQRPTNAHHWIMGFGASRFAAMELCKDLRGRRNATWNKTWLIDDNVVYVTNFPGWNAIEVAMNAAPVASAAAFVGGTLAEPFAAARNYARANINLAPPAAAPAVPPGAGIIQQLACWNVDNFNANRRNFGVVFLASAEDLSMTNLFLQQGIPYRFYGNMRVEKEVAAPDGAIAAGNHRRGFNAWITGLESTAAAAPGANPPPPIQVQPANPGDGGVQLLSDYIVNRVLPNSIQQARAGVVAVQNEGKSHGVEQIATGAIQRGWVAPATIQRTFQLNGPATFQRVVRVTRA